MPAQTVPAAPIDSSEARVAYFEAATTSVFRNAAGGAFMIPFLLTLGAHPIHIGLLGSAPFLGRVGQILLNRLTAERGARSVSLWSGLADRAVIALVALIPLWAAGNGSWLPWVLVGLIIVAALCGELYNVALQVWFSERVPSRQWGQFYAKRTQWAQWMGMSIALSGAWLAQRTFSGASQNMAHAGIASVILIGCAVGVLGIGALRRVRALPQPIQIASRPDFRQSFRTIWADANFRRFIQYSLIWGFGVNFSSPFYVAYAVESLGYDVGQTVILAAIGLGTGAILLPFWGKISDRYGNRPILIGCGAWAASIPILWVTFASPESPHAPYFIEVVSGAVWSGINLAAGNMILKLAPPSQRVAYIGVFTAICGGFVCFAPILGGALIGALGFLGTEASYKIVFVFSFVLRAAGLSLLRFVQEGGSKTLEHSVRVLHRSGPSWIGPAGVGTALLWIPTVAESVRRSTWAGTTRAGKALEQQVRSVAGRTKKR